MAFTRPTLRALVTQSESEINALIVGADARLRFSVLNVFAWVWAALYLWRMQQDYFTNPVADMNDDFPVTPI